MDASEELARALAGRRSSARAKKIINYNDDVDLGLDERDIREFEARQKDKNTKRKKKEKFAEDDEVFEVNVNVDGDEDEIVEVTALYLFLKRINYYLLLLLR